MTRHIYETKGGAFSEAETFAQLIEYLRLAEEAAYIIGHYRKAQDDDLNGQGWLAVGEMLKKVQGNITSLATGKLKSSRGYN